MIDWATDEADRLEQILLRAIPHAQFPEYHRAVDAALRDAYRQGLRDAADLNDAMIADPRFGLRYNSSEAIRARAERE